jgi:hypothetical protein
MSSPSTPVSPQRVQELPQIPYKAPVSNVEKGISFGIILAGAAMMATGLVLGGLNHNFDLSTKAFTPMDIAVVGGLVALIGANRFANALQYRHTGRLTACLAISLLFGVGALLGHQLIHSQILREIATIGAGSLAGVILIGSIIKSSIDEERRKRLLKAIVFTNDVDEFNRLIELDPSLINERITFAIPQGNGQFKEINNETLLHAAIDLFEFNPTNQPMIDAILAKITLYNPSQKQALNASRLSAISRFNEPNGNAPIDASDIPVPHSTEIIDT